VGNLDTHHHFSLRRNAGVNLDTASRTSGCSDVGRKIARRRRVPPLQGGNARVLLLRAGHGANAGRKLLLPHRRVSIQRSQWLLLLHARRRTGRRRSWWGRCEGGRRWGGDSWGPGGSPVGWRGLAAVAPWKPGTVREGTRTMTPRA
jgi:hypothetical protein